MTATGPLRRVLKPDYPEVGRLYGEEPLECGHNHYLSAGWSLAMRRHCRKCVSGAPRDFDPAARAELGDK